MTAQSAAHKYLTQGPDFPTDPWKDSARCAARCETHAKSRVQQEAGVFLWHHALHPSAAKLATLVASGVAGVCLAVLEAPGTAASERCCALGILLGIARTGEAGRTDLATAHAPKVLWGWRPEDCFYESSLLSGGPGGHTHRRSRLLVC